MGVTGEKRLFRKRPKGQRTKGEIECSEYGGWHMAIDTHPERNGICLAHYLGKGEPSQYRHYGKLKNNTDKPCRGIEFGGNSNNPKHDEPQGIIVGSGRTSYRMGALPPRARCYRWWPVMGHWRHLPGWRQLVLCCLLTA